MFQTIKECTADMDSDTWNAYHIISNRARSVCYATRQQLFRRRAEHTVNSLISTATSQLDAMKDLKVGFLFTFLCTVSSKGSGPALALIAMFYNRRASWSWRNWLQPPWTSCWTVTMLCRPNRGNCMKARSKLRVHWWTTCSVSARKKPSSPRGRNW